MENVGYGSELGNFPVHYAASSSFQHTNQIWHCGKGVEGTHCHLSCPPKDVKMCYGKGLPQQKSTTAKVHHSNNSLLPTCLLSFPSSKRKSCLRGDRAGLLSCEELLPSPLPFHAIAAFTTAHCHLDDKPVGPGHTPLNRLIHEPNASTLLSSELSISPWPIGC